MLVNYQNRITSLVHLLKEIPGKVEFHKIIFILQNEGIDFDKFYKYNVFGPYSEEFQLEINDLVEQKILISKGETSKPKYILNNEKYQSDENEKIDIIQSKKDLINRVGHLDREMLELVSTIYYFRNLGYSDTMIKAKLSLLKPNLVDKFNAGVEEIKALKNLA